MKMFETIGFESHTKINQIICPCLLNSMIYSLQKRRQKKDFYSKDFEQSMKLREGVEFTKLA